jgi:hypothetical protein
MRGIAIAVAVVIALDIAVVAVVVVVAVAVDVFFASLRSRQNHKAVGILPEGPHWCYDFNCSSVELPPTTCKDTAKARKSPLCLPCQARALSGCGHMQSCC